MEQRREQAAGGNSDVLTLRQGTLPLVATPMAVVGWAWLTYALVRMGGDVVIADALAPAALFVCGVLSLHLNSRSPSSAALVLLFGLETACFTVSFLDFGHSGPYSFVLVTAVASLLLQPIGGLLSVVASVLLIAVAGRYGLAGVASWGDITGPGLLVCLTAVVSALAARNLYAALEWAWQNAELARERLEEARDRQEELNRIFHSLDDMYELVLRARRDEAIARQQAEEGQRLKTQFASNVSHELRTPLNAIIGFSELMHMAPEVYGDFAWPSALRSDINEIYRNALHLQRLIDDILDLAQLDAMRMPLMAEEIDIAALIRDTVGAAASLVRGKDVRLEVDLADGLPLVRVDPTRVRQVLLNLLSNACRFTERGRVLVSAATEDGDIHISVADTGIGMTPAQLGRLFREFEQADGSLRRRYGGTGLGLALSKRFVELHGGRIWAESERGVGTTVHFVLPLAPHPLAAPTGPEQAAPERLETRTVVVYGTVEAGFRLLARYATGYHLIPSSSLEQTLALIEREHPWAVVVAADGPEPARALEEELRRRYTQTVVPVLSYTVDGAEDVRLPGDVEWFTKPVKRRDLLAALRRVAPQARTVLIVDDEPADVQLLARMLRSSERRYAVLEAYSGSEALQVVSTDRPDAVLLDMIMPGLNGLQVLEALRSTPGLTSLPVLMVTAGNVAAEIAPLRAPHVRSLSITSTAGLRTQEWLTGVKGLLDAVSPRYVSDAGQPESRRGGQTG